MIGEEDARLGPMLPEQRFPDAASAEAQRVQGMAVVKCEVRGKHRCTNSRCRAVA